MREDLRELWKYRELLLILVQRDLKVRYKNSILGFGWSLLNPLLQVLVMTVAIKFAMRSNAPNYSAYVFCAMLPWLFFSIGTMDACPSLVAYYNLIRRTYFPRELIPLASVAANLIHFLLSTAVFLVYMTGTSLLFWFVNGRPEFAVQPSVLLLPIPMIGMLMLVTGVSFFVSVWNLYFRDVVFIADSALKILLWVCPVLYFPEIIPNHIPGLRGELLYILYMLNPLAGFITAFRKLALAPAVMPMSDVPTTPMGAEEWLYLAIAMLVSFLVARLGYHFFSARKWRLAERA